jgi:hypothetical protein
VVSIEKSQVNPKRCTHRHTKASMNIHISLYVLCTLFFCVYSRKINLHISLSSHYLLKMLPLNNEILTRISAFCIKVEICI